MAETQFHEKRFVESVYYGSSSQFVVCVLILGVPRCNILVIFHFYFILMKLLNSYLKFRVFLKLNYREKGR